MEATLSRRYRPESLFLSVFSSELKASFEQNLLNFFFQCALSNALFFSVLFLFKNFSNLSFYFVLGFCLFHLPGDFHFITTFGNFSLLIILTRLILVYTIYIISTYFHNFSHFCVFLFFYSEYSSSSSQVVQLYLKKY